MGIYKYTRINSALPPIPILPIRLLQAGQPLAVELTCSAILDTGSDCTLIPIPLLQRVNARIVGKAIRVPVCGVAASAIPYVVGMFFDQHHISALKVFGCAETDIDGMPLIGRDVMNRYRIEFDGPKLEFEVF